METEKQYTIRKIGQSDKEAVLKICSKIWEGNDYIPSVFEEWVADTRGEFTAVLYDDVINGFGKMTFLTDNDVWFEGLRADVDSPHRGSGRVLTVHYLEMLKKVKDIKSIRFSTYFRNIASQKIAEKAGFRLAHILSNKTYAIEDREIEKLKSILAGKRVRRKAELTFEELCSFVEKSAFLQASRNFLCIDWKCYPYSREMLKKHFYEPHQYCFIKQKDRITGLLLYDMLIHTRDDTSLCFIETSSSKNAEKLFQQLKEETARNDIWFIESKLPTEQPFLDYAKEFNMESWEQENDFLIYEYPIAGKS